MTVPFFDPFCILSYEIQGIQHRREKEVQTRDRHAVEPTLKKRYSPADKVPPTNCACPLAMGVDSVRNFGIMQAFSGLQPRFERDPTLGTAPE
jgi:hypothetical protein